MVNSDGPTRDDGHGPESERLDADTGELVRVAAAVLAAPWAGLCRCEAGVSEIVASFPSDRGAPIDTRAFCELVAATGEPVWLDDAAEDPRVVDPAPRMVAAVPVRAPGGESLGVLCVVGEQPHAIADEARAALGILARQIADVSLRRRERLRLAREHAELATHRRFFDLSLDLLCTADEHLMLRTLSPSWRRTLGWTEQELRARPLLELVHPDDRAATVEQAARMLHDGRSIGQFECRVATRSGEWVWLSWSALDDRGTVFAIGRDVTARRRADDELQQSARRLRQGEARLRAVFDALTDGLVHQAPGGAIIDCNGAAERILGLPSSNMLGHTLGELHAQAITAAGAEFPATDHPATRVLRSGTPRRDVVLGLPQRDGETRWISINSQPLRTEDGLCEVVSSLRDVTAQREARRALRDEREFLGTILDNLPDTFVGVFDGSLEFQRSFGHVPGGAGGLNPGHVAEVAPEAADALREAATRCLAGEPAQISVRRDQRLFDIGFVRLYTRTGAPRALLLARDVTEREALRERITRQERLVTTGTLAAGVGHEINNPLQFVDINLAFAITALESGATSGVSASRSEIVGALQEARAGADRIRKIVRGLRSFARVDMATGPTDLRAAIEVSADMAAHELRKTAELVVEIDPLPLVEANEAQLAQVFVNLLVNAAQAFATHDPARNRVAIHGSVRNDGAVEIRVTDNAAGIAPAVLERIFDPFFTTKPVGIGTGLGLSISHGIIAALGGEITCASTVGVGTTFTVVIPRARVLAAPEPAAPRRRGKVVVLDDEDALVRSLSRVLRDSYEVASFTDAREAMAALLDPHMDCEVIVCDLLMPYLSGVELHARVRASRPELASRFVFISASEAKAITVLDAEADEVPRLEKPFDPEALRAIIREVARAHPRAA